MWLFTLVSLIEGEQPAFDPCKLKTKPSTLNDKPQNAVNNTPHPLFDPSKTRIDWDDIPNLQQQIIKVKSPQGKLTVDDRSSVHHVMRPTLLTLDSSIAAEQHEFNP